MFTVAHPRCAPLVFGLLVAAAHPARPAPPPAASHPLTLTEVVGTALTHNPGILRAEAGADLGRAGVGSAWAPILPHLGAFSAGYQRSYYGPQKSRRFYPGIGYTSFESAATTGPPWLTFGVGVSTDLLSYYRWRDLKRSQLDREASELEYSDARAAVAFGAVQDYYGLVGSEKRLDVAIEAASNAREREARARAFYEVGSVARGDVSKATRDLAQAQLDSITAVNDVAVARARLAATMGLDPETPVQVVADLGAEQSSATQPPAEYAAAQGMEAGAAERSARASVSARPDIKALEARADAAAMARSVAKAATWPSLSLSYGYGWSGNDLPGSTAPLDKNYTTTVSVDLSIPFFDWQGNRARIAAAGATARLAEYQLESARQTAVQDLVTARLRLREAVERIEVARKGLAAAEDDYAFSRERYGVGAGTSLELRDAQLGLSRARLAYIDAQVTQRVAEAALARAEGRDVAAGVTAGGAR